MNTNMPISVDNKLLKSLPQNVLQTILILSAAAGLAKEIKDLVAEAKPEIRHAIDKAYDYAMAKLALENGYHPSDISDRFEASIVCESSAA